MTPLTTDLRNAKRLIIRGDGSFTVDPKGDWISARHYDEALTEIDRLQEFINSEFFQRVTYKQENETLRQRNAWLEDYVKACDNKIKRARGVLPTVDVSPVLDHRFLPDGMDPGICQKCGSTRASHRDASTRPAEPSTQCPSCGLNHGACMC